MSGSPQASSPVVPKPLCREALSIPASVLTQHAKELGAAGIACLMFFADCVAYVEENAGNPNLRKIPMYEMGPTLGLPVDVGIKSIKHLVSIGYIGGRIDYAADPCIRFPRRAIQADAARLGYRGLAVLAALTLARDDHGFAPCEDLDLTFPEVLAAIEQLKSLDYMAENGYPKAVAQP